MIRAYLSISFIALWGCFSGCFSMGLPEPVAPAQPVAPARRLSDSSNHPRALVVIPPSDDSPRLGHQFLFGILPVTNLYLQHSPQSLTIELTLQALEQRGYETYSTTEDTAARAASVLKPRLIVKPELHQIQLNAFDAFFFRILKARVDLQMSALGSDLQVIRQVEIKKEQKQYRRFAYAPALAAVLTETVGQALEEGLGKIGAGGATSSPSGANDETASDELAQSPLVELVPPRFEQPIPPALGQLLASSYGFRGLPPYTADQIRRMIQRGMSQAFMSHHASIVLLQSTNKATAPLNNTWRAEAVIHSVGVQSGDRSPEQLFLDMTLEIKEMPQGTLLLQTTCAVRLPQVRGVDGSWVVTLERAAEQLTTRALQQDGCTARSELYETR